MASSLFTSPMSRLVADSISSRTIRTRFRFRVRTSGSWAGLALPISTAMGWWTSSFTEVAAQSIGRGLCILDGLDGQRRCLGRPRFRPRWRSRFVDVGQQRSAAPGSQRFDENGGGGWSLIWRGGGRAATPGCILACPRARRRRWCACCGRAAGHGFARSCARCGSCDRHASAMPFAMPSRADLDGNGVVDAVDLALVFLALAVPIGQIARFEPRTSNWTEL